jgi:hypothetical protein
MARNHDAEAELPDSEKARLKRRDRKRETRMVVDNAGVRRVIPAIRKRKSEQTSAGGPAAGGAG